MAPPRSVAGLPAADPKVLARAWLAARIVAADLDAAPDLANPGFVARAPAVCALILEAIGDDTALAAVAASSALVEVGGPAPGRAEPVVAAEALRGAFLEVMVPRIDPSLLPAVHDRLAHACALLAASTLRAADHDRFLVHDARRTPPEPRARLTAEAERLIAAGAPFAVLAVEVEDAPLLPAGVLAAADTALRTSLPSGAVHAPDGPGSLLALVRDADGRETAGRLVAAVGAAAAHRGAPLRAAAGLAEHPRDGASAEALLAHADGRLFAARADGLPLV